MGNVYKVLPSSQKNYQSRVEWFAEGKRHRKFFVTLKKAEAWAQIREIEIGNSGTNALGMTERLRVDALHAHEVVAKFGKTLLEAANYAAEGWALSISSRPVKLVVSDLIKAKKNDGISDRYRQDLKNRLAKFVLKFGERKISDIAPMEIRQWIDSLPFGPVSKNNTRRTLSVLWTFATEREWCKSNLIEKISSASEPSQAIGILTPEQAGKLLFHSPPRSTAILAVGLFAGLRRSECCRLTPESIRKAAKLVEANVKKTRGAARRFVKIRPVLKKWLDDFPLESLTEQQYRDDLETARVASGIETWPKNCIRHSFCSYALAHDKKINELALEMGHTNPATLFAHYRELVTPAAAKLFWSIDPAKAKEMAENENPS